MLVALVGEYVVLRCCLGNHGQQRADVFPGLKHSGRPFKNTAQLRQSFHWDGGTVGLGDREEKDKW